MFGAVFFYLGLIVALAGAVPLLRPRVPRDGWARRQGGLVVAAGLAVSLVALFRPVDETRIETPATRLDEYSPRFEFSERHVVAIDAPKVLVWESVMSVTADEISFFRALTWLRRFGRPGPESILNVPEKAPVLEVATRTGFLLLAEEPGREIVLGTIVLAPSDVRSRPVLTPAEFRTLESPGYAKATMSFLIEERAGETCLLTTETRVHATDEAARRRFAAYWRVIYPGSSLLRRMWLRAIRLRAEAANL